jgi:hypothetical protein
MKELRFLLKPCHESARRGLRTALQEQQAMDQLIAQLEAFEQCTATRWIARPAPRAVELVAITDKSRDELAVWLEPLVKAYGLTA